MPLQTLNIKFPFTGTILEHGSFPLSLATGGAMNSLFVAAEECIAELKLTSFSNLKRNSTHKASVVSVHPARQKHQVGFQCHRNSRFRMTRLCLLRYSLILYKDNYYKSVFQECTLESKKRFRSLTNPP